MPRVRPTFAPDRHPQEAAVYQSRVQGYHREEPGACRDSEKVTTDHLFTPTSFVTGRGGRLDSPQPPLGDGEDEAGIDMDTELEEFYGMWLPFVYGLDSSPV